MDAAKNLGKAQVSTGYNAAATSIVLVAGGGAKLGAAPFTAVWWNYTDYPDPADDPNAEYVRVTTVATDTLTVTRAHEGSTATNKNTAGKTYMIGRPLTADMWNTQLMGALGYQIPFQTTALFNPTASGTVYIGQHLDPGTVVGFRKIRIAKTGRIFAAYLDVIVYTTLGSAQTSTLSVRVNNTTDYQAITGLLHTANLQNGSGVGLNGGAGIPVTAGDYIEMKLVYGAFVTAPTNVMYSGQLFLRPD